MKKRTDQTFLQKAAVSDLMSRVWGVLVVVIVLRESNTKGLSFDRKKGVINAPGRRLSWRLSQYNTRGK